MFSLMMELIVDSYQFWRNSALHLLSKGFKECYLISGEKLWLAYLCGIFGCQLQRWFVVIIYGDNYKLCFQYFSHAQRYRYVCCLFLHRFLSALQDFIFILRIEEYISTTLLKLSNRNNKSQATFMARHAT